MNVKIKKKIYIYIYIYNIREEQKKKRTLSIILCVIQELTIEKSFLSQKQTSFYYKEIEDMINERKMYDPKDANSLIRCDTFLKWMEVQLVSLYKISKSSFSKGNYLEADKTKDEIIYILDKIYKLLHMITFLDNNDCSSYGLYRPTAFSYNINFELYAKLIILFDDFKVIFGCLNVITSSVNKYEQKEE